MEIESKVELPNCVCVFFFLSARGRRLGGYVNLMMEKKKARERSIPLGSLSTFWALGIIWGEIPFSRTTHTASGDWD